MPVSTEERILYKLYSDDNALCKKNSLSLNFFSLLNKLKKSVALEGVFLYYTRSLDVAGWSSLAARRAHNPKVVGSNPTPATK